MSGRFFLFFVMLTNDIISANLEELEVINNRLNEMHETVNDCFETGISLLHGAAHLLTTDLNDEGLRSLHTIVMQATMIMEKCYSLTLLQDYYEAKQENQQQPAGSRYEA